MGLIERWTVEICAECGKQEQENVPDACSFCDSLEAPKTVEVVALSQLEGAVQALRDIQRQTPRLPATDPVTGEPSPWTIAADYFTDFGGQ